jgi:hypothetical protein
MVTSISTKILKNMALLRLSSSVFLVVLGFLVAFGNAAVSLAASNPYPLCSNGANCTHYAWDKFAALGIYLPGNLGNAKDWGNNAANQGYQVNATPELHALVVFQPNVDYADKTYGHVAFVEQVSGNRIQISEQNCNFTPAYDSRWVYASAAGLQFIHPHLPTTLASGKQVKLSGTNLCFNAHYRYQFAPVNMAYCDQPDPDQLWTLSNGQLKLSGTNLCFNAHYRYEFAPVNIAYCDPPDPDQVWTYTSLGQIKLSGTNFCFNAHYRYQFAPVNIAYCDPPDSDQVWSLQ